MLITPKLVHKFNQIPTKNPTELFLKSDEILSGSSRKMSEKGSQEHFEKEESLRHIYTMM